MSAVDDAVEEALYDLQRVYRVNRVPAKPAYPYAVFSAQLGRGDGYTLDSSHGLRWGRVVVQVFSDVVDGATARMEAITTALLDKRLPVAGWDATPLRFELDPTPPTRDPDTNGVVGITAPFTFTATPQE